MRISRQVMFMEMAKVAAKRSTCFRLAVGAVITHNNRVVSIGYNGVPAGEPHCSGNDCPGREGCTLTIHAEMNALAHLPVSIRDAAIPKDIYITDSPCFHCANVLPVWGIRRVFFERPYRIDDGCRRLIDRGVEVYRMTSSGYVIEWSTNDVVELP